MQQFIPFENDWDALENMRPETLVPYRVGYVPVHGADGETLPVALTNPPPEQNGISGR